MKPFDAKVGIELQYELNLQVKRAKDDQERARSEQFRSASVATFTVLTYVTLWELQRRIRAAQPDTAICLIRLQHSAAQRDRLDDADDANTAVYAASQAIEKALAREGAIKLQGVTTQAGSTNLDYKRRGALHALVGGHPLKFTLEGSLDRVAMVPVVTGSTLFCPLFSRNLRQLFRRSTRTSPCATTTSACVGFLSSPTDLDEQTIRPKQSHPCDSRRGQG